MEFEYLETIGTVTSKIAIKKEKICDRNAETTKKWGVSERRVQRLCEEKCIP